MAAAAPAGPAPMIAMSTSVLETFTSPRCRKLEPNPPATRSEYGPVMPAPEKAIKRVVVEGLGRLPQFCHATVAGGWIHVSGTLGTQPASMDLVAGGTGPQTTQTMRNIETILGECGAELGDVVKVSVFLEDMDTFPAMNEAYSEVVGSDPPARITVGRAGLALGAAVEIECIAFLG
ncbi:MAG: reactive intermediate/imine deaminase [Actinobacteria bacterium]|nr:MAG: reactive intermediate/imine deaminase [Actinomycetota bacterium]